VSFVANIGNVKETEYNQLNYPTFKILLYKEKFSKPGETIIAWPNPGKTGVPNGQKHPGEGVKIGIVREKSGRLVTLLR
jgi:hypothetical protein